MCKEAKEDTNKKCDWYNLVYSFIELIIIISIVKLCCNFKTITNLHVLVSNFIFFYVVKCSAFDGNYK